MDVLPPADEGFSREALWLRDRLCGRRIMQVTSAATISHHIYPESATFTPDGEQVAFWRVRGPRGEADIFLAHLPAGAVRALTNEAVSAEGTCIAPTVSPDGKWLYYIVSGDWGNRMRRVSLDTFERQDLWELPPGRLYVLGTISPDGRWFVTGRRPPQGQPEVIRIDLAEGTVEALYSSQWVYNPHPIWDPSGSGWLLVQENTGYEVGEHFHRCVDGLGARLIVMRADGSDVRQLDLGRKETEWIQGHQTWRGRSGEVAATAINRPRPQMPWRQQAVYGLTTDGGRRILAAGHAFSHVGADASGRWVVCDVVPCGHIYLIDTDGGKCRFVCASDTSFGAPQYTHPHPAISPDARWIVFNSDRSGIAQLYVVEVGDITGAT